jgi:hypothetical protein
MQRDVIDGLRDNTVRFTDPCHSEVVEIRGELRNIRRSSNDEVTIATTSTRKFTGARH